jgi:nucleotide-binding universal stress UspA family protein
MQSIVCATRGGEACRRTQEKAVALAKERGAELTFLYIVDPSFVGPVDELLADAVSDEMTRLGRALLRIAQLRAREQGLDARTVVHRGAVQQGIKDYLRQVEASMLVIGAPRAGTPSQAFTPPEIQRFAQAVRQDLDIEVIVAT